MNLAKRLLYLFSAFLVIIQMGCAKEAPAGNIPHGMVALSFDDAYIDNWFANLPLLDSMGIKATFYVSAYHSFSHEQKNKLRIIEAHGNEVAYHTSNHADLVKLNRTSGANAVIDQEIRPDLNLMKADGFNPVNFAYPFGQHDDVLNLMLLQYFKSVRVLSHPPYNKSYACYKGNTNKVFYSIGIDSKSKLKDEDIRAKMQVANANNTCVFLYAHAINDASKKFQISADRIRFIGRVAREYNLQFVTTADMTN